MKLPTAQRPCLKTGLCLLFLLPASQAAAASRGDSDGDCDRDLRDFRGFQLCFGRPDVDSQGVNCKVFDFNVNGDVDAFDYAGVVLQDFHSLIGLSGPGVCPPIETGTAVVLGTVFDATNRDPLACAEVYNLQFPGDASSPHLPIHCRNTSRTAVCGLPREGVCFTDSNGRFEYDVSVEGSESYLVQIRKYQYSENLRRVDIMAGRCWTVDDAFLNPANPPKECTPEETCWLCEPPCYDLEGRDACPACPDWNLILEIPPHALPQTSLIGLTKLFSNRSIRGRLPPLVASQGLFSDIGGVFGETTNVPVTLRVRNQFDLPLGSKIRFGKIDHNTLKWMDLCNAFDPTRPCPAGSDLGVGVVKSDANDVDLDGNRTETLLEVKFDHFCNVCTGYCLADPTPIGGDGSGGTGSGSAGGGSANGGGQGSDGPGHGGGQGAGGGDPGNDSCNSVINRREGFLWETVALPSFQEMGEPWGLSLGYSSQAAGPSVTLGAQVDYTNVRPVERTHFSFSIEGVVASAYFGFSQGQTPQATYFWNGRNAMGDLLPTGAYAYEILPTSYNAQSQLARNAIFGGPALPGTSNLLSVFLPGLTPLSAAPIKGRAVLMNLAGSPYGAGWSIIQEHRLHRDPDGCKLLTFGNADWRLFAPDRVILPPDLHVTDLPLRYKSPPGDFSNLVSGGLRLGHSRTLRDGTEYFFEPFGKLAYVRDRYGHSTNFTYESDLLRRVTSPTGFVYDLEYADGKLARIVDSAGRETRFEVDASGDLTQVTDAEGAVRTFDYENHLLRSHTGPRGEKSVYDYENGRVVAAHAYDVGGTLPLRTRQFRPSALNGEISAALARGEGTFADPIPLVDNRIDRYTDGRGSAWEHETDLLGRTIRTKDPLDREVRFVDGQGRATYDDKNQLTSRFGPTGLETRFTYDANGNLTSQREMIEGRTVCTDYSSPFQIRFEHAGPFQRVSLFEDQARMRTNFTYFDNGSLKTIRNALGVMTEFAYGDPAFPNLPTQIVAASGLPEAFRLTFTYDAHGNLATVKDPDPVNPPTVIEYQSAATCPCPGVSCTAPVTGFPARVRDPRGAVTSFVYDDLNRTTTIVDAQCEQTHFSYLDSGCGCSTGNLTKVSFANGSCILYEYDGLGRLTKTVDQLGCETGAPGHFSTYAYDAESNLKQWTNRNGETAQYEHDEVGRLVGKDLSPGGQTTFRYDKLDNLTFAANSESALNFGYDDLSRLCDSSTRYVVDVGLESPLPREYLITDRYDAIGGRESMRASADEFSYQYDDLHRLTRLISPGGRSWTFEYDALNRRKRLLVPNGVVTTYQYNAAGQVAEILHQTVSGPIRFSYDQYDPVGNLLHEVVTLRTQPTYAKTYEYDALSRLTRVNQPQPPDSTLVNVAYQYDEANRLLRDTEFDYEHDAEGRMISKTEHGSNFISRFHYDAESRMRQFTQEAIAPVPGTALNAAYGYDPLGRRVLKDVNGVITRYVYDNEDILFELDRAGNVTRRYTHGPGIDEPLALEQGTALPVIVADSARDFSAVQGSSGWFYGYYADAPESFAFQQMTQFVEGPDSLNPYVGDLWWVDRNTYWTNLFSTGALPSGEQFAGGRTAAGHWAVRRWVSNVEGSVVISGTLSKEPITQTLLACGGDGVTGHILVDGAEVYSQHIASCDATGVDYTVSAAVHVGSTVDFAVQAGPSDYYDWTRFTGKIAANREVREGDRLFYHADRLGSVVALTSQEQIPKHEYQYDSFGRFLNQSRILAPQLYSFTGRESDPESGLLFLRARYYDPDAGRFQSEDQLGLLGGLNLYTYVGNNAPNRSDPFGLEAGICPASPNSGPPLPTPQEVSAAGGAVATDIRKRDEGPCDKMSSLLGRILCEGAEEAAKKEPDHSIDRADQPVPQFPNHSVPSRLRDVPDIRWPPRTMPPVPVGGERFPPYWERG